MTDGWAGPGTLAPDEAALSLVEQVGDDVAAAGMPVALTADDGGTLVLEWTVGNVEYTACISPTMHLGLYLDDLTTGRIRCREYDHMNAARLGNLLRTGSIF